jgi:hypothetical protein
MTDYTGQTGHDEEPNHVVDELPALLSGELDRATFNRVVRHLDGCDSCRRELVDVSAANAALRTVATLMDTGREGLAAGTGPTGGGVADDVVPPHGARRRGSRLVVPAAAAVVVLAAVAAGAVALAGGRHGPTIRRVQLVAVGSAASTGSGVTGGTVTMTPVAASQQMQVRTVDLAAPPSGSFYEVWLFNPTTGKMLPVGVLAQSGVSSYQLADDLVAGYTRIDVSLQRDNGNPEHSKTSVLRATYG